MAATGDDATDPKSEARSETYSVGKIQAESCDMTNRKWDQLHDNRLLDGRVPAGYLPQNGSRSFITKPRGQVSIEDVRDSFEDLSTFTENSRPPIADEFDDAAEEQFQPSSETQLTRRVEQILWSAGDRSRKRGRDRSPVSSLPDKYEADNQPVSPSQPSASEKGTIRLSTNPEFIPMRAPAKRNPFFETMPLQEIWHRHMPALYPFGETAFTEREIGRQINEDLEKGKLSC